MEFAGIILTPLSSYEDEECSICFENLSERPENTPEQKQVFVVSSRCFHNFHNVCMEDWITNCKTKVITCPICRDSLKKGWFDIFEKIKRLFTSCLIAHHQ